MTYRKPNVYLAGKITGSNWRELFLPPGSTDAWGTNLPEPSGFTFAGPQGITGCGDRACARCTFRHATHGEPKVCSSHFSADGDSVFRDNTTAIQSADIVLAYINEADAFGTLAEIGYASALGKHVVLCLGPKADSRELWFVAKFAAEVHDVRGPAQARGALLAAIATWNGSQALLQQVQRRPRRV